MKLPRRRFLHLAAGAAAFSAAPDIAAAQNYPARPVRILVGFAAGGANDTVARLIGQWLSERLGHTFIIENRPGASSNLATEAAISAAADGYTLLMVSRAAAINATLYDKLNFVFGRDIAPVGSIMRIFNVVDVYPAVPVGTMTEFIAHARANPGKFNMGSAGIGSSQHVSGELFKAMTGLNLVHVPDRGGAPAIADLLGGHLQVMFDVMPEAIEYIRAGKLRPLAVTSAARSQLLPDIPTVSEFVPGYEASGWYGLGAPKNTPADIIDKLNNEINAALADPWMKTRLADLGGTVLAGSPADFANLIAAETEKWGKVIRAANIKAE